MEQPMSGFESGLHKTIAHIESRLADMGGCGDCAYERAMVRSYRQLLSRYRRELFIINSRRFLQLETPALVTQLEAE